MIGLAAVLFMAMRGRILGVSGIIKGLLQRDSFSEWSMRAVLVLGMILGPVVYRLLWGQPAPFDVPVTVPAVMIGAFIVGMGVSYGGGCTSGHGVCGIARMSPRSMVATAVFMGAAFVTVFVTRHLIGGL